MRIQISVTAVATAARASWWRTPLAETGADGGAYCAAYAARLLREIFAAQRHVATAPTEATTEALSTLPSTALTTRYRRVA